MLLSILMLTIFLFVNIFYYFYYFYYFNFYLYFIDQYKTNNKFNNQMFLCQN
jgi:hypothetical protein